jgi:putative lipoprotein
VVPAIMRWLTPIQGFGQRKYAIVGSGILADEMPPNSGLWIACKFKEYCHPAEHSCPPEGANMNLYLAQRRLAPLLLFALIAARVAPAQVMSPVRGTATYRERIALPANAVFEATLEDVSRADAQPELIARVQNEQPGNPPIPFVIAFDAGRINPGHSYAVRARILVDDRVWFTTSQNYPVFGTAGRGSDVQLLLRRASGTSRIPSRANPGSAPLENTYWKLTSLGGSPIVTASRQPEAHLIFQPANRRVTGSGGCNRLSGSYQVNGDRIALGRVASTMMACVDGMKTEQNFLKALGRVNRWRISGQRLELLDAAGTPLASFDAVYM